MPEHFTAALAVETLAAGANLVYILLLIRERIACWAFGIVGSLLSVWLFVDTRLYSEALLYFFYAVMGVWGWLRWRRREAAHDNPVVIWRAHAHLAALAMVSGAAVLLGYVAQTYSDAERPVFDAFTTCFSFFATYLEIAKVLEAWVYWFALNLASIWLYHDRSLDIYAALIGVYSVLSIWGFFSWLHSYRAQQSA